MISILLILFVSGSYGADEGRVRFTAVLFRHGDRTPVDPYPNDPWRNESLWPVKFGELTNVGKQQHYALGQWLRKRYSHLLSPNFDPSEIYIRSSDVDRTLMSAQANLAGMYPPVGSSVWNPELLWQPIPVHTVPESDDNILAMKKNCPAYNQEYKKVTNSAAYRQKLTKYKKLMDYLSGYAGKKVKDYYDILNIYSVLYIETLYNFTLPKWTQAVYPDAMKKPAGYSFKVDTSTPLLARLKVGPFMKLIASKMMDAMAEDKRIAENLAYEQQSPKVLLYSGHDLTVGNVLNALGMFDNVCPPYTATVFFELFYESTSSERYIRISYRNTTEIVEPHILSIPNCGKLCPFDRFLKLYDNLISVNWEYECEKMEGLMSQPPALLCISLFFSLTFLAIIYVRIKCFSRRLVSDTTQIIHTATEVKRGVRKSVVQNIVIDS